MRSATTAVVVVSLLLGACGGSGGDEVDASGGIDATAADAGSCTGDIRATSRIFNGTEQPSFVPLTPGQIIATGTLPGCSGTLIAPSWVLTAAHCGVFVGEEFCIGTAPSSPDQCFTVANVINHPTRDTALLSLGVDVRDRLPEVEPIPIMTEMLDQSWIGNTAEAAGYGDQETGSSGEREFSAEPISGVDDEFLTIDGEGARGACFGDSGGPVMVIASDKTVRVAGDLSWGAPSCLDKDNYARTDVIAGWIEGFTGPTIAGTGPYECGAINAQGRCMAGGATAMWCAVDDTLSIDNCAAGSECGWDASAGGYRCITESDPCGGVDEFGACSGGTARWCEQGQPRQRDCGSCGEICQLSAKAGGASCVVDPCMGLDYLGRCNGNVAEWCDAGRLQRVDCTDSGETCEYINNSIGYYCN